MNSTSLSQSIAKSALDLSEFNNYLDQFKEVNRLIILGNGFDLAHGLKTSYKDFIYDYCLNFLEEASEKGSHEDELLRVELKQKASKIPDLDYSSGEKALNYILFHYRGSNTIKVNFKSDFFRKITSDLQLKRWVDIEQVYFDNLKLQNDGSRRGLVPKLNNEFTYLSGLTTKYLIKVSQETTVNPCDHLFDQFCEPIKKRDCMPNTVEKDMESNNTCILNFNYTNTAHKYFSMANNPKWSYIAIHGELEGDNLIKQKPIFGYGDELNENYQSFETSPENHFFTHIKSFKYLEFDNYRSLLEFIESNPFQVQLYGHSCGLSDRTLLNTIFENNNCISIKQFYHKWEGGDDFESKGYAISRHFRSKSSLRSKVVNKAYCVPMAQPVQVKEEKVSEK